MKKEHLSAELMAAYIDRAVTDSERGQIEGHLVQCQECLTELTELVQQLWRWEPDRPR
jgi:anti-sigma factor RsiW